MKRPTTAKRPTTESDSEEKQRESELKTAIDLVDYRKQIVLAELMDSGLSEKEVFEIFESWGSFKLSSSAAINKKKGILVLQGMGACLNEFEILIHAATKKTTAKGDIAFIESLTRMGMILNRLGVCSVRSEGKDARREHASFGKKMVFGLIEAPAIARKACAENAARKRQNMLNRFKEQAGSVARKLWERGVILQHHQMASYLAEEYEDCGKHPFSCLPKGVVTKKYKVSLDNVLLEVCKDVATNMGRRELISGLKKIS